MKRIVLALLLLSPALPAQAQSTSPAPAQPAAAPEPAYPVIRVGVLSYLQYLAELENRQGLNAFDVTRAYLNINGQLSRNVRFRLTPDIRRVTDGSLGGSLVLRLKYAFGQVDNLTPGGALRFGLQAPPWIDFEQGINRYRVQGTVFAEREGLLPSSADFGASYQLPFLSNAVDLHAGVFNGEGSGQTDANKYKSVQARLTVRPLAGRGAWNGLRISGFVNGGWYAEDRPRHLGILMASFEHTHVVATAQVLKAVERPLATLPDDIDRDGTSYFIEVRQGLAGWAGLLRVDQFDPDAAVARNSQRRIIAGGSYWFQWPRGVRIGLVATDEQVDYVAPARPDEHRLLFQTHVEF